MCPMSRSHQFPTPVIEWGGKNASLILVRGGSTMSDRVVPGPVQDSCGIREAVCIHTKKIYDSCKEEDIALYML